jgi:hypothetical protein
MVTTSIQRKASGTQNRTNATGHTAHSPSRSG